MKKYTTLLLVLTAVLFNACMDDEYKEAESFEEIVKEIAEEKNVLLIEKKECYTCDFDETTPEVIYCDNGVNEQGKNVILQISQGTVVEIVGSTLLDQIVKVSKSSVCSDIFACNEKIVKRGDNGNAFVDGQDTGLSFELARSNCQSDPDFDLGV